VEYDESPDMAIKCIYAVTQHPVARTNSAFKYRALLIDKAWTSQIASFRKLSWHLYKHTRLYSRLSEIYFNKEFLFIYLFISSSRWNKNVVQPVVEPAAKCKQALTRRSSDTVDKLIATAAATNPLSSSSV